MVSLPVQAFGYSPPPTPPAPAQAVGFTKLLRRNVFTSLSGFDLSNTGVDGFDWYLRFAWPSVASDATGKAHWAAFTANSSGNLSIANGSLLISGAAPSSNLAIASACYSSTDGRGYVGTLLPRSFYAESSIVWAGYSYGQSAFWSMPLRFLNGTANTDFVEQDWAEPGDLGGCVGNCVHQGALQWHIDGTLLGAGPLVQSSPNPVGSETHLWGALCMAPADNTGTSLYHVYLDNVKQTLPGGDGIGLDILDTDRWIIYYSGGLTTASCDFWVPP